MGRWLGVLTILACLVSGCGASARGPAGATPTPRASVSPTAKSSTGPSINSSATVNPTATPIPSPASLYSQEQVGKGKYQLVNNITEQFVEASASGLRTFCSSGVRVTCTNYVMIAVTAYSGNTRVVVSPRQFALANREGVRYAPATARQAAGVLQPNALLSTTVLTPDDDGDYASGTLLFLVPKGTGRFNLLWQGRHVATFVTTARGKLNETR